MAAATARVRTNSSQQLLVLVMLHLKDILVTHTCDVECLEHWHCRTSLFLSFECYKTIPAVVTKQSARLSLLLTLAFKGHDLHSLCAGTTFPQQRYKL